MYSSKALATVLCNSLRQEVDTDWLAATRHFSTAPLPSSSEFR